ncbi:MAG: hypothetical protein EBU53_02160 [Proteobacteria bacterium]|nr:hypothetical protein [Pseudomonadota bacterium]
MDVQLTVLGKHSGHDPAIDTAIQIFNIIPFEITRICILTGGKIGRKNTPRDKLHDTTSETDRQNTHTQTSGEQFPALEFRHQNKTPPASLAGMSFQCDQ